MGLNAEEEYWSAVTHLMRSYPNWRYGQSLFNALYDSCPHLANRIRGTGADPFFADNHDDRRVLNFLKYLEIYYD